MSLWQEWELEWENKKDVKRKVRNANFCYSISPQRTKTDKQIEFKYQFVSFVSNDENWNFMSMQDLQDL